MECLNTDTLDTMLIAWALLGVAAGIIIGVIWSDSIHKNRKG